MTVITERISAHTETYNNAATIFRGHHLEITNTASHADSTSLGRKVDNVWQFGHHIASGRFSIGNIDPKDATHLLHVVGTLKTTGAAALDSLTLTTDLAITEGGTGASSAADARTNLDVDQAGTDNSTPVTLAGENYLTLSSQEITANKLTLAHIANISTARILGRNTAGSGVIEELNAATTKTLLSLDNVENTALSTWAGSSNLTTLGTIATGSWNATTIPVNKGGTGQTSYTNGQLLIGNTTGNTLTLGTLTGTSNQVTVTNGTGTITLSTPQDLHTAATPTFSTLSLQDGAASAPSLTNTGDTDTGIFFPADNVVAIAANGAEQWRIDSNGAIGIGTTTPLNDIGGNASYDLTGNGLHFKATRSNFVLEGSQNSRIVLSDSGATTGERNFRIIRDGSYTKFEPMADDGSSIANDLLVINHTNKQVGFGERDTEAFVHIAPNGTLPVSPSSLANDLLISYNSSEVGMTIAASDNKTAYFLIATPTGGVQSFLFSYQHDLNRTFFGPQQSGSSLEFRASIDSKALVLKSTNVGISTDTFDASAQRTLAIENGVAPAAGTANQVYLYSRDVSASAELHCMDEAGNETQLSAHIPRHVLASLGITPHPDDAMPLVEKHCNCVIGLQYITYRDPFTGVPQTKVIVLPDTALIDYQTQQQAIRDQVDVQITRWDAAKVSRDESIAERQTEIDEWQSEKDLAQSQGREFTRPRPKDIPEYDDTPRPQRYTIKPEPQLITDGRPIRDRLKRTPNVNVIFRDQPL